MACPEQTTPISQRSWGLVTIIHPYHPLCGQQVEVVRLRRGANPTLVIRASDGRHMAIALEATDYVPGGAKVDGYKGSPHLLDIEGLWQAAQFIAELQQRDLIETAESETVGKASYD